MKAIERMVMFYLPRICNHCLNPSCVASCPSGAMYKRGEDGIVLINQDRCRAWRSCISACPYKKTYYNWSTGKSEKCILCFPRLEAGEAPACFHSCVGRIRYLGNVLYDADMIKQAALRPDDELVEAQRDTILDPHDPAVIAAARKLRRPGRRHRVGPEVSPVYRFAKEWKLGLPLHVEYRTFPMLFYVPPLLPVMSMSRATSCAATSTTLSRTSRRRARRSSYLGSCSPRATTARCATRSRSSWRCASGAAT